MLLAAIIYTLTTSSLSSSVCEGFVLKKDQKKEVETEQMSLEDLIEREVCASVVLTQTRVNLFELFFRLMTVFDMYNSRLTYLHVVHSLALLAVTEHAKDKANFTMLLS